MKLLHVHGLDTAALTAMKAHIVETLRAFLPQDALIHSMADSTAMTAVLIPCAMEEERSACEKLISNLSLRIRQFPGLEAQIAVSMPFEGMEKMPAVFRHLNHLLRLVGTKGERVVWAGDLPAAGPGVVSGHHCARFGEMLMQGKDDAALVLLDQEVEALKALGVVKETDVQQLFFLYRHQVSQVCAEMQGSPMPLPDYRPQWTVDEIFDQLRDCCRKVCDQINLHQESSEKSFENKVIGFINGHLSDPDLCVSLITDQFNISESSLRRILTKAIGGSFSEYVEAQRMALARNLLAATDLPVGKIPEQCGYASANSFYKAFRRHFAVSPSSLRKLAQKGVSDMT